MKIRTPENVSTIKEKYSEGCRKFSEDRQQNYETHKTPQDPETLEEWVEREKPRLIENLGLGKIHKIYSLPEAIADFLSFDYWVLQTSPFKLLSSDRPCIFVGPLDSKDCIIALPLSPSHTFFAFKPDSKAKKCMLLREPKKIVYALNRAVVRQAKHRTYAENKSDVCDKFLLKHLSLFS